MDELNTKTSGKELVTLRKRAIKGGGYSLYLDHMSDGVRTREFLRMYLVPERTKLDKLQNRETLKQANALKSKRILQIQEGYTGIRSHKWKDMLLTDYITEQQKFYKEQGKPKYALTLSRILRWINKYNKRTTILTIDIAYILDFCRFMRDGGLSEGSIHVYFAGLNTIFNNAYRAGIMRENPINRIERFQRPKNPESEREYLTLDEVKLLAETRCGNNEVKRAFLFACFTGLRLSDIEALRWEQIHLTGDGGYQVEARQIKTGRLVYIPMSANALSQLPQIPDTAGHVFVLPSRSRLTGCLNAWVRSAGITKHITFHCSRHTYATMLLTYGADIYTVMSLLGHTNVATTQIYAKIVDASKRKAVNLIPDLNQGGKNR